MASKPKYLIDTTPDKLSEEEVKSTKDYHKLVYRYQKATTPLYKTPLYKYKNRRIFMGILLIIMVIWVLIILFEDLVK